MNISKLLKITALSCVAVFSINSNIVNAADKMDIDDMDYTNNNDNYNIDNLTLLFAGMDISDNEMKIQTEQLINGNQEYKIFDNKYGFNNIVISNGNIVLYCKGNRIMFFCTDNDMLNDSYCIKFMEGYFLSIINCSSNIQNLRKNLKKMYPVFKVYQANTDNNGKITSLSEINY